MKSSRTSFEAQIIIHQILRGGGQHLLPRADEGGDRGGPGVPRQEEAGLGHDQAGPGARLSFHNKDLCYPKRFQQGVSSEYCKIIRNFVDSSILHVDVVVFRCPTPSWTSCSRTPSRSRSWPWSSWGTGTRAARTSHSYTLLYSLEINIALWNTPQTRGTFTLCCKVNIVLGTRGEITFCVSSSCWVSNIGEDQEEYKCTI